MIASSHISQSISIGRRQRVCRRWNSIAENTGSSNNVVYFSKLKRPTVAVFPRSRHNNNSIDVIVDGSAFDSIDEVHTSENIVHYGKTHGGFEYPLKLEIFNHIRSEPRPSCKTDNIYYVAIVQTDVFEQSRVSEDLIPSGFEFYMAQYNPMLAMFTCDWRDDVKIDSVIFGPALIREMLKL